MSQIKIKRARAAAAIGRYPATFDAMLARVPAEVVSALTSAHLARMLDALADACDASKALATRSACDEGAIWDARRSRLREIAA